MKRRNNQTAILWSVGVIGLLGVILQAQSGRELGRGKGNTTSGQSARVIVSAMPDAPLKLAIPHPESTGAEQYAPSVDVVIENTSDKDVSSYAIRYDLGFDGELRRGGVELNQSSTARSLLRPGDTRSTSVGDAHYSRPIERVVVSLDFVEFTDGSTWGPDTYSSKEVLAGMRAGARTLTERLLRVLRERGLTALSKELDRADDDMDIQDRSAKWLEGFQRGKTLIRERAKREMKTLSNAEAQRVLTLPVDALDEIKRR